MPVLSGYDAFKVIADRYPNVPVVILSGYVCDIDELKDASGRAPNAVLTKPCSADRLIAVLQRLRQETIR
jgi:CheY-like chemotaxis protein